MIPALLISSALGGAAVFLAARLFRRALSASHDAFLMSFGIVFGVQGALFAGLLGLAWACPSTTLPLLAPYVAIVAIEIGRASCRERV